MGAHGLRVEHRHVRLVDQNHGYGKDGRCAVGEFGAFAVICSRRWTTPSGECHLTVMRDGLITHCYRSSTTVVYGFLTRRSRSSIELTKATQRGHSTFVKAVGRDRAQG